MLKNPKLKMSLVLSALIATASCDSFPANKMVEQLDLDGGYRFNDIPEEGNTDSLFVIVTFSGGGTRAAALSYGVLEKLKNTQITWKGETKSLLSEVDVISSVSGGSFTSAYYGLFREKTFLPRGDPEGYKDKMLYRDLQSELYWQLFNPLNWFRLASADFGRIDLASELYNDTIFDNRTYTDLKGMGRPYFMVNATDMSKGVRFSFVQERFDYLCSDLGPFKVGRAVAASSDFPVAFTPLTLVGYGDACEFDEPSWMVQANKDRFFSDNTRRWMWAQTSWQYRNVEGRHPYVHLVDGGIADNIGLRGPLRALETSDLPWSISNKVGRGEIEKLVVIVVDAKTQKASKLDQSVNPPGVVKVLEAVTGVPMDNFSLDTVERLRDVFEDWQAARQKLWNDPQTTFSACPPPPDNPQPGILKPLDLYAIYVGFDQIDNKKTREKYLNMDTSFYLPSGKVTDLINIGPEIMNTPDSRLPDGTAGGVNQSTFQKLVTCLQ
jgi:NTE family protein